MLFEGEGAGGVDPAPAGDPWYKGADETFLGELQRRGIADKGPLEVAQNLLKSHLEAERMVGAPANELVRWPKDANDPNWQQLRARLGVPAEPKDYDFSTIKDETGKPLVDDKFADTLRTAAHRLNIGKDSAVELAKTLAEYQRTASAASAAEIAAKRAGEEQALRTNWGANYDANRQAAVNTLSRMLEASGMAKEAAAEAINALEAQVGGSKVMEMFRSFSTMAREDTFTAPNNGGPRNTMSYTEAQATKQALMRDDAFVARWNKGDMEAIKQMAALDGILVAQSPETDEAIFRRQLAEQAPRR